MLEVPIPHLRTLLKRYGPWVALVVLLVAYAVVTLYNNWRAVRTR